MLPTIRYDCIPEGMCSENQSQKTQPNLCLPILIIPGFDHFEHFEHFHTLKTLNLSIV